MSDHRTSTTAPASIGELSEESVSGIAKARTADEKVSVFMDMEDAVCNLRYMSIILGDMLDDNLRDGETGACAGQMKVWLSGQQLELLSFAWNDVIRRANEVHDAFYAAAHGEAE